MTGDFTLRAKMILRNGGMLAIREKYKLSQGKLAKMVGCSLVIIAKLEKLQFASERARKIACTIAEMFEVPLDSILPQDVAEDIEHTRATSMQIAANELRYIVEDRKELMAPEDIAVENDIKQVVREVYKSAAKLPGPGYLTFGGSLDRHRAIYEYLEEGHSIVEAQNKFKLTGSHIRQMMFELIRIMRHPVNSRKIERAIGV